MVQVCAVAFGDRQTCCTSFPLQVNIKLPPFNAKGDGVTDDTVRAVAT
jgi:hypothetical protein